MYRARYVKPLTTFSLNCRYSKKIIIVDNLCKNCGGLILGNNIICDYCVEEISENKKKIKKEKEEKESWKNQWESLEDKPIFNNIKVNNPYSAAVVYHLFICLILLIGFPIVFGILSFLAPILGFLGEAAGSGLIVGLFLPMFIMLIVYFYRLIYFIGLRVFKKKPKAKN